LSYLSQVPLRLGLFGGTFDPVHNGHTKLAAEVKKKLELDRLYVLVASNPWQKESKKITPAFIRFEMAKAAFSNITGTVVSDLEINRPGPTYTIDTVNYFKNNNENCEIYLIIGSDIISQINTWQSVDELKKLVTLIVVTRPGYYVSGPMAILNGFEAHHLVIPGIPNISSTEIREMVNEGIDISKYVSEDVYNIIQSKKLYK
jgi:nicotinate-nucleotide adenylyltransferase